MRQMLVVLWVAVVGMSANAFAAPPTIDSVNWTLYDTVNDRPADFGGWSGSSSNIKYRNPEYEGVNEWWVATNISNWSSHYYGEASIPGKNVRGIRADIAFSSSGQLIGGGKGVIGMKLGNDFEIYIGTLANPDTSENCIAIGYRDGVDTFDVIGGATRPATSGYHNLAMFLDDSGKYISTFVDGELFVFGELNIASAGVTDFFMDFDIKAGQSGSFTMDNYQYTFIPEPGTLLLLSLGGLLLRKRHL